MSWHEVLVGARVRRIDAPAHDLLAITLYSRDLRGVLLVGLPAHARGVGWVDKRPPGRESSLLLQKLKSCFEGGKIASIERPSRARLRLHVLHAEEHFVLEAVLRGSRGNALLRSADDSVLCALYPEAAAEQPEPALDQRAGSAEPDFDATADLETLRAEGQRLLESHGGHALAQSRAALERGLRGALRRAQRRLLAIEGDLARATQVGELRRHAALVVSNLHRLPRSCAQAELLDYNADPPQPIVLSFDPALGPKLQAEAWFRRARKLERGVTVGQKRAEETRASITALSLLLSRVASTQEAAALVPLASEARELGVRVEIEPRARASTKPRARLPYREFAGNGKRAILVGRGPADNDRLTLDHARPHDLWLHVRDEAGAHVVVPLEKDEACPPDLLCDAATLAAHFSQARGQTRVDVTYTDRRYVTKPRKTRAGLVSVLREKVFRMQLEPARLQRLLKSERPRSP